MPLVKPCTVTGKLSPSSPRYAELREVFGDDRIPIWGDRDIYFWNDVGLNEFGFRPLKVWWDEERRHGDAFAILVDCLDEHTRAKLETYRAKKHRMPIADVRGLHAFDDRFAIRPIDVCDLRFE